VRYETINSSARNSNPRPVDPKASVLSNTPRRSTIEHIIDMTVFYRHWCTGEQYGDGEKLRARNRAAIAHHCSSELLARNSVVTVAFLHRRVLYRLYFYQRDSANCGSSMCYVCLERERERERQTERVSKRGRLTCNGLDYRDT